MRANDVPELQDDPFVTLSHASAAEEAPFEALKQRPVQPSVQLPGLAPALARLQGFDLLERPLVGALHAAPGGVFPARTTVALKRAMLGREVLVVFEDGAIDRPVIVGVIEPHPLQEDPPAPAPDFKVLADGERHIIEAEREIVLKCGEASITLTRAGKVIIRGSYILSRSTGYNKIKGAAIDIN
ncbi:MAG TPA: DUF6484 domain-containing protein [Rubrivivax sp.]|nr:DUF6484 domain-containing protein [Rubrivivax sp.]